jgi:CRISPR/Cas system-associated exonuclease Cas4 (RecB family)
MTYFLEDVARYLYNLNSGDFRNTIVVFPNRRARLFFNKYISGFSMKPVWAPRYYSISEFIQQLSGLQLADQLSLIFKLFRIYKEITCSNETFDTFYFYCEMILADFSDIDKNLVDAEKLYQNLSDLKAIDGYYEYLNETQINEIRRFWEIFISARKSDEKDHFTAKWVALKSIYAKFNKLLDEEGTAYEGKIYRMVIDCIEMGTLEIPEGKQIAFVGFNALNRAEEVLFEHLKKSVKALFFWDFDDSYINSDIHEAGFFLRKYLRHFPQPEGFKSKTFSGKPTTVIKSVSVPSNISQAKIIDMFLDNVEDIKMHDPGQTAIILTDENLLLPVINSLPSSIGSVNISMGYPVADTPANSFINLLADVQKNQKINPQSNELMVYHKDFFGLMDHIYLESIGKTKEFIEFKRKAHEKNLIYINPENLETDSELYMKVFSRMDNPKYFGGYLVEILIIVASDIVKKGAGSTEKKWHLETIYSIYKILLRFDSLLTESGIDISLSTVLSLLKKIVGGISVPFSGEPLTGLQLMGILETRTLDFKNIIFLSMNEGKYPKTGHAPSMIPYSLREGFGLPTINHQDAIYAYYFYRLLHRAEKVTLVYNTKSEGLQKGEKSRFLLQLKYDSQFEIEEMDLGYKVSSAPNYRITGKKDKETITKLEKYLRPGGDAFLSPSSLNNYLNCKLRFYFRYIEGMKEPEIIEEDIETDVFGRILHKTMDLLYTGYVGQKLQKEDIEKIYKNSKLIRESVNRAFAEEYLNIAEIDKVDLQGRNLIIRKVIEKYVDGILKFDYRTAPFHIISLEKWYSHELSVLADHTKIALGGYIDRIDIKDGYTRVIDYKTGLVKDKFDNVNDLFDAAPSKRNSSVFQAFLYSLIVQDEFDSGKIMPALFYVRNIHQKEFDYKIKFGKAVVEGFSEFSQVFTDRLVGLIEELYNTDISFTQTEDVKYCKNCPYNTICMRKG